MTSAVDDVNNDPFLDFKGLVVYLKPSKRKKIRKVRVVLKGSPGITNAAVFKDKIFAIFDSYDFVDFYLENVDSIDLPFIQTLYHVKQMVAKDKKVVTIDSILNEDMKKIIIRSGFEQLLIKPKNV